jgi:dTDP-4-amino-4,6-dideoxy-D-galactose acyltransferase
MAANPELCTLLDWDTSFFGVTIARVNAHQLDTQAIAQVINWCQENKVRCLYFLADSNDVKTLRLAEANGFYLTDIRVSFERSLRESKNESWQNPKVRLALPEDVPGLRSIASSSYHDTRFYYDGHFSSEACDRLYETWIEKSVAGYAQAVLVTGEPGQPEGFITCSINGQNGEIGLVGVSEKVRGRGLGGILVLASLHWFAAQELASVQVVTQGRNVSAQRLYQKCGFITKDVKLWYHRWFGE